MAGMIVACPVGGHQKDRVVCMTMPYLECRTCGHRSFKIYLVQGFLGQKVDCPVMGQRLNSGSEKHPVFKRDLEYALEFPTSIIRRETCLFGGPFLYCPSCPERRRWKEAHGCEDAKAAGGVAEVHAAWSVPDRVGRDRPGARRRRSESRTTRRPHRRHHRRRAGQQGGTVPYCAHED